MDRERLRWIISGIDWDQLTRWEEEFVESVELYFQRYQTLSDRQEEILERIFKEKGR